MVTHPTGRPTRRGKAAVLPLEPTARRARRRPLRTRVVMLTPDVATAVETSGGWLFDHAITGCDVLVLAPDTDDLRPLRILGVRTADLEKALSHPARGPRPHALVVDPRLHHADSRVRGFVRKCLEPGLTEVWSCGTAPPEPEDSDDVWEYRLSRAARAFKAQAFLAAGVPLGGMADVETFHRGESLPLP